MTSLSSADLAFGVGWGAFGGFLGGGVVSTLLLPFHALSFPLNVIAGTTGGAIAGATATLATDFAAELFVEEDWAHTTIGLAHSALGPLIPFAAGCVAGASSSFTVAMVTPF